MCPGLMLALWLCKAAQKVRDFSNPASKTLCLKLPHLLKYQNRNKRLEIRWLSLASDYIPFSFGDVAGTRSGCSPVTNERSPQDWSYIHWIIEHSSVPKVRRCMEVFSFPVWQRGRHGETWRGAYKPSVTVPPRSHGGGIAFPAGGICRVGQGDVRRWAILAQGGVMREAVIAFWVF